MKLFDKSRMPQRNSYQDKYGTLFVIKRVISLICSKNGRTRKKTL